MGKTIEKVENTNRQRLSDDVMLELYASRETTCDLILKAEAIEQEFASGVPLMGGTVSLSACLNEHTGLWEACLEAGHGLVIYTCVDELATKMDVTTIPSTEYLRGKENLTEAQIKSVQMANSKSLRIDLSDVATLKKAKLYFADDYVLRNLHLNNVTSDNAARMVIWHIRAYRKAFMRYQNVFAYLWQKTSFKSVTQLARVMREKGLLREQEG